MSNTNPKRFNGAICTKHPDDNGIRYISDHSCVVCKTNASKKWHKLNPEKSKAAVAKWAANNRDIKKIHNDKYISKNVEKVASTRSTYRAKTRDEAKAKTAAYRAAYPDKVLAANREWNKNNPDKVRVWHAKRRAAQLQRTPPWANHEEIAKVYAGAALFGSYAHVDHIVPLQGKLVSGLHVANNLRVTEGLENMKKHNFFDMDNYVHEIRCCG